MTVMIDGKKTASQIQSELVNKAQALKAAGLTPCLAVVLVGDDPASQVYVRNKHRVAQKVGIKTKDIHLPKETSQTELLALITKLNNDPTVHAILVQMPLPAQIDAEVVINAIAPEKDADGLHPTNIGHLFMDDPRALACTPRGIMTLLEKYQIDVVGKEVVIIGRSNLVGRPLAALMLNADATVTITHSKTKDLKEVARQADILVVATGRAEMITKDYIKEGAVVIDVGINRLPDGHLVGDVAQADLEGHVSYLTPVPGGVGPMTIAMLMQQTLELAEKSR